MSASSIRRRSLVPSLIVDLDTREDQSIDYSHLILIECSNISHLANDVIREAYEESLMSDHKPPLLRCLHEHIPLNSLETFKNNHREYRKSEYPVDVLKISMFKYPTLNRLTVVVSCSLDIFQTNDPVYDLFSKVFIWTFPCFYYHGHHQEHDCRSNNIVYCDLTTKQPFISKTCPYIGRRFWGSK